MYIFSLFFMTLVKQCTLTRLVLRDVYMSVSFMMGPGIGRSQSESDITYSTLSNLSRRT